MFKTTPHRVGRVCWLLAPPEGARMRLRAVCSPVLVAGFSLLLAVPIAAAGDRFE